MVIKMKREFEDDGRTVADMSGVARPSLFGNISGLFRRKRGGAPPQGEASPHMEERLELNPQQMRWAALGALSAALLVGAVFIIGLGIVVAVMVLVW